MRHLSGVTLACIDTLNHALALRALAQCRTGLAFDETLLLTDALPAGVSAPDGISVQPIERLASRDDYSRFVLKSLGAHVNTPHVLLIQWDGYVINPASFEPAFTACDYVGAKWSWHDDGMRVGNGGFSMRSRKLLEALQDPRITLVDAEDVTIGRAFRPLLEREHGIRFADEAVADRFAFEAAYPVGRPFGFHGLYNFCRVVPENELAELAPTLSDAIARSMQFGQLLRNCVALGQWRAAEALARRRVAALPADGEGHALLARVEASRAQGPSVARNDPCPCGSGKRYKNCHGALGNAGRSTATTAAATSSPALTPRTDLRASPSARAQQGFDAHRRGDLDTAERAYRDALRDEPAHPLAQHYLGVVMFQRSRFVDALPLLERSVLQVPTEPEFHNNLGLVLAALDRNDDAVAAYRRALQLKPDHATASNNLGLALQAANRLTEAIAAFERAVAVTPAFAAAHWNLALALLANGDYADGWREYEWRLQLPELGGRTPPSSLPRWRGEPLDGKTLVLTAEQGIGDAVQFTRFAPALASRGARVIVQAAATLCPLLATAPGVDAAIAVDVPLPPADFALPLLSLGHALGVKLATLPGAPYLASDALRRTAATSFVADAARGRRPMGLVWAGAPHHLNDRRRSLPAALLAPLLALPGIAWFSLQKGPAEAALDDVASSQPVTRLPPDADWLATAAIIDALDAVVTVDTSVAHVAGALGKPVLLLLPFAADWRWGVGRTGTPWYPTARLFRQRAPGDWPPVVDAVASALRDPS
ncbi:MAG: DUF5672 family protein [Betaproteobacteria bacterium]